MPINLEVTPSSYDTLRVSWSAASGATQYMILYSALNHGEPDDAKEVIYFYCLHNSAIINKNTLVVNETMKFTTSLLLVTLFQ